MMQTGFQLINLPVEGARPQGLKCAGACATNGQDGSAGKFSDFMDIMEALMALQPEQLKESVPALEQDPAIVDSNLAGDGPADDPMDLQPSELMALFLDLKGVIQQELEKAGASDKADKLLNMAEAIINDTESFETIATDPEFEKWKAQWLQMFNKTVPDQAAAKNVSAISQSAQIPIAEEGIAVLQNAQSKTDQHKVPVDADSDSIDDPASRADSLDALSSSIFRKTSQTAQSGERPVNADPVQAQLSEKQAHDQLKLAPMLEGGHSDPDPQTVGQEDQTAFQGLMKSATHGGNYQGAVPRMESLSEQGAIQTATGEKSIMLQDKTLQSDVIRQIVQRMSMHTQGGQSKMVIHLKPEYLGNVHMQVLTENHQVTVRMMADSLGVKEIVEQNIQHLRAELQHHGLEIQKFDVFVANDNEGWKSGQEQAGFKESQRQKRQRLENGKVRLQGSQPLSAGTPPRTNTQKELNEIDYFA